MSKNEIVKQKALRGKTKIRHPIHQTGLWGGLLEEYDENEANFSFRFKLDQYNLKNFSEITELNFVAESYARACLTLLKEVNKYNLGNQTSINKKRIYRYLPAMFCFRHYLELRLKCLYMDLTKESFSMEHSLSKLLEEVKNAGFNMDSFDKAVEYISNLEKNDDSYFRYLISKSFKSVDKLTIPVHEFAKVNNWINKIEIDYNHFIREKVYV